MPAPRRRNPLGLVLLAVIGLTLAALGGLVISGLTADSSTTTAAYQNDDYQVPPPDTSLPYPDSRDV